MGSFLVVGAGIAGCASALELAQYGHLVDLIERASVPGGKVLNYCCKATEECSRCGVCMAHTILTETIAHSGITLHTGAKIAKTLCSKGHTVEITSRQPLVDHKICDGCGACVKACPEKGIRLYLRGGLRFCRVEHDRCRLHNGRKCDACVTACKSRAISIDLKNSEHTIESDGVVIATGHQVFDAAAKPRFGYERLPNVMDGETAEAILAEQSFLVKPDEDVAFVQCVGSRDSEIGRNYCSAVCCAYATRMARVINSRSEAARATVYYNDLQKFDKTFTCTRSCIEQEGVNFVRSIPFTIDRMASGRLLVKMENDSSGRSSAEHDAVVLSVGMGPDRDSETIGALFGLNSDEFGFLAPGDDDTVVTAGTCARAQGISESMINGRNAALQLMTATENVKPGHAPSVKGESMQLALDKRVLVLGSGLAGASTARALCALGYEVSVAETPDDSVNAAAQWAEERVEHLANAKLTRLDGHVGGFAARLTTDKGNKDLACGAVVACTGVRLDPETIEVLNVERTVLMGKLPDMLAACHERDLPRSVALVLDLDREEGISSTEMVLRQAQQIKAQYACEVYIFCREMRVAAPGMENRYRDARGDLTPIVKYSGQLKIDAHGTGVQLTGVDALLNTEITVTVDLVGISPYGLQTTVDPELIEVLRIATDIEGQMQANNLHLSAGYSGRAGVFAVGSCCGRFHQGQVEEDARATALEIHALLSPGVIEVALDNTVVDSDKCVLCLTCMRVCPHGAIRIDREEKVAVSVPQACQKCGTCVGECPAEAIDLPDH